MTDSNRLEGSGMLELAVALVVEWDSEWAEALLVVG